MVLTLVHVRLLVHRDEALRCGQTVTEVAQIGYAHVRAGAIVKAIVIAATAAMN